jgi:hypothetical protein
MARSPSPSPLPRPYIQRTKNSWVGGNEAWSETFHGAAPLIACGVRSPTRQHSPQLQQLRAGLLVDSIVFVFVCGERERESSYMDWTYRGKKLVIISPRDSLLSTALCMADIQDASCFHTTPCRTNESKPCILISTLVRNFSSSQTSSSRRTFHSHVSIAKTSELWWVHDFLVLRRYYDSETKSNKLLLFLIQNLFALQFVILLGHGYLCWHG